MSDVEAADRATYVVSKYPASINATPLLTFYIIVIPSLGVVLVSIAMTEAHTQ